MRRELVDISVECIRDFASKFKPPLWVAFSGGKDSVVLERLCQMAGVDYELHYSCTTVDPPELVQFIKAHYSQAIWHRPEYSMWELIGTVKTFCPLRQQRWCCEYLKEQVVPPEGQLLLTGIRWQESKRRSERRLYEPIKRFKGTPRHFMHPIIGWRSLEIWEFIKVESIPYCGLYDEGFNRLGCVLCPQQGQKKMRRDADRWPKYAAAYIRALDRAITARKAAGKAAVSWETGDEWLEWWIGQAGPESSDCQLSIFEN